MSPVAVAGDVYVVGRGAPGNGSRIWQGEFVDVVAGPQLLHYRMFRKSIHKININICRPPVCRGLIVSRGQTLDDLLIVQHGRGRN